MRGYAGPRRVSRGFATLFVSLYSAPRPRLAATVRAIQSARRVSQRRRVAVCLRLLCGGMRRGGADGARKAEAVGPDRTGEALARKRSGVGFQRVDKGADRSA